MSEGPWWATAIQWTVWAVIMSAVMGWLGRSRFNPRDKEELGTLRHPKTTLITGLVCFAFFAALTVLSAFTGDGDEEPMWWATAVFGGFAAMSAPMILDYFMARHRVSDDGLAYRKLLGTTGFLRWSDLSKVRYGLMMKWFRLETTDGSVVRISAMLMGLPEFAQALLKAAPAEAMDTHARQLLEATADGNPPSLWT